MDPEKSDAIHFDIILYFPLKKKKKKLYFYAKQRNKIIREIYKIKKTGKNLEAREVTRYIRTEERFILVYICKYVHH